MSAISQGVRQMPSENTILLAIELSASAWLVAYRFPKPRSVGSSALQAATRRRCWR